MLAVASLYWAFRGRRYSLLHLVAGVAAISIAGSLYAFFGFPAALYDTEFVGFVLLFPGFAPVPGVSAPWRRPLPPGPRLPSAE